jgi:lipoyl(octanoyl) transferase
MMGRLAVYQLGRVEYEDGLKLQKLFGQARAKDLAPDALLLLEHPPVLTLGRGAKGQNIVASREQLSRIGAEVFETDRGGDVTYHGPGQIVGYPILRLPPERHDVRRYVRDLEEAIICTLARFNLRGERLPQWPGVWVLGSGSATPRKIAALGVHISRWQTSHGFALNVNTDLAHFELIVPCGIQGAGVTSMQQELQRRVPLAEVEAELARSFGEVFGADIESGAPARRTVSAAVVRKVAGEARVLLLKRRPERGGFWQIVTGWIEPGESAEAAAEREVLEETGQKLPIQTLNYRHSFAFGDSLPPSLVEETAFAASWTVAAEPHPNPGEHETCRWMSVEEAVQALPFAGLRAAVRMAAARS